MKIVLLGLTLFTVCFCSAQNKYELGADSKTKDTVRYGEHIYAKFSGSKIFPGTIRNVNVYVPNTYDGQAPAAVCVFQDGMGYNADTVVSNLIASKEIPVMILIAASPGKVIGDYDEESPRENRTYEYDTPSELFGEFLLKELLPFVENLQTKSGKKIKLSKYSNDRMITGCSSGAACAFNVAWNTNGFSRVYSSCGSYTGLRGSFTNATLVHKFETKPIRFFLQSGSNDMWTSFGDWWSANQAMVRALDFAGYDYKYKFTENAHHCDDDVNVTFPDAMRFLWKGYPANPPAPAKRTRNAMLNLVLIDGENFEPLTINNISGTKLISDNHGRVLLAGADKTVMVDASGVIDKIIANKKVLAVGKNDELLLFDSVKRQISIQNGKTRVVVNKQLTAIDAVALRDGGFYVLGNKSKADNRSVIWYLSPTNQLTEKSVEENNIRSLALSGNNNWLYTFGYHTRRGYSYKVDGQLKDLLFKQEFFYIHLPDQSDGAETTSAITDDVGRTYLATNLGIQICDYNGRSEGILSLPGNVRVVSLAWGGKDFNWLYALGANGKLYKRKLNTNGSVPSAPMPKTRVGAG